MNGEVLGIQKRKAIVGVVLALVLTVAAVAVIGQITSYGTLMEALHKARKWWLPLGMLGELVAYGGYLAAYRCVARADGGPLLRYRDAAQVITLGLGAYVIGSGAGGLSVDFWAMREAGAELHEAARRTLALNTLQAAALAWLAAIAAVVLLALGAGNGAGFWMAVIWVAVVPAATAAAYVASGRRLGPSLMDAPDDGGRPHGWDPRPWIRWLRSKLRKALGDAIGGVVFTRHVISHPRRYLGGVIGYPLFWVGDFFLLWVTLQAFGVDLEPWRLVVAEATAWALSFLPLPGGGAGAAEATITFTLHAVGVPLSPALFAALTYRAVNFWLPILPALVLVPHIPSLRESLAEAEHTPRDEDAMLHGDQSTAAEEKAAA